jgi:hypothetical protein
MTRTAQSQSQSHQQAASAVASRCFECGQVWPRESMRWGNRAKGPVWFTPSVRVLRCPDCLPA